MHKEESIVLEELVIKYCLSNLYILQLLLCLFFIYFLNIEEYFMSNVWKQIMKTQKLLNTVIMGRITPQHLNSFSVHAPGDFQISFSLLS